MRNFQRVYRAGDSLPKKVVSVKEYGVFFEVQGIGETCDKYLVEEVEGTSCFRVYRYTEGSDSFRSVIPKDADVVAIRAYGDSIFVAQNRYANFYIYINDTRVNATFKDVTWVPLIHSFGFFVATDLSGKTSVFGYRYDDNVGLVTCFPEKRSEFRKWYKQQVKIAYGQVCSEISRYGYILTCWVAYRALIFQQLTIQK